MAFNWACPHCGLTQVVTDARFSESTGPVGVPGLAEGRLALEKTAIGCSNPDCRKLTLSVRVGVDNAPQGSWRVDDDKVLFAERIIPNSSSKPQPVFIPAPLVEDYYEACAIRDLSPKASATLTRRCLQGMIRDFCGISKGRLIDEINTLRDAVAQGSADRAITDESVQAIDQVRGVGNIGAHMEKDINIIVPVDAGEAQLMIELIEMLFDEWYGARERRRDRLSRIAALKATKDVAKKGGEDGAA